MIVKAELAFYKSSKGGVIDWLISMWTWSKYSHVELIVNGEWYSSSQRDLKVRKRVINRSSDHWDFIEVYVDSDTVNKLYQRTKGASYDWEGIFLSQFFPLNKQDNKKWFCSEWVAEALGLVNSNDYSPGDLFRKYKDSKW